MARLVLDRYGHPYAPAAPDPSTLFTSEPSRPLPPYDAPDFQDELQRKVHRAATVLANVERFTRARDSAERRMITGPRGMFRVILTGFTIVGAEVSEHGLHPSDRMGTVSTNAADQNLEATAFAVTDLTGPVTTADLKSGYDKMYSWLNALFKQVITEFDSFGDALGKCADWYETR